MVGGLKDLRESGDNLATLYVLYIGDASDRAYIYPLINFGLNRTHEPVLFESGCEDSLLIN